MRCPKIPETSGGSKDKKTRSSLNGFLDLPEDVIGNILHRLGGQEILGNAQRVCSSWRNLCKDPSMWHFIDMKHRSGDNSCIGPIGRGYLVAICRKAVVWSLGQLTQLHIDYFATDGLLDFISATYNEFVVCFIFTSARSSKLKCLQIRGSSEVEDGLIEAAKKFSLLEELHFVYVLGVHEYIEPIGQSCPKLNSFTLSSSDHRHRPSAYASDDDCNNDYEALAIAKSMPGLRHLRLVGNNMTNEGLQAILDGCPYLESLDIRRCFNVDLYGGIGDRIAQKIKDFKCPNDPLEKGCVWDADVFYCPRDYSYERS
ncbi:unnamed protein product [Cuscuta campestris]|uniref:F-box domain-containing protein n=1 Tax=Cuscuta campestris TaxID=132261 RepID=A0A484LPS2_9ASTE|nr:unnamed protein product [Cuscuta campestris]